MFCLCEINQFLEIYRYQILFSLTILLMSYFFHKARVSWFISLISIGLIFLITFFFQEEFSNLLGAYLSALMILAIYYLGKEDEKRRLKPMEVHKIQKLSWINDNYLVFFAQCLSDLVCLLEDEQRSNEDIRKSFDEFLNVIEFSCDDSRASLEACRLFRTYPSFYIDFEPFIMRFQKIYDFAHLIEDYKGEEINIDNVKQDWWAAVEAYEHCFNKYFRPYKKTNWASLIKR